MNNIDELNTLNIELKIIFGYLLKKGLSKADAEDIVQETAYRYLLYFDSIKNDRVRGWLFRVAINLHYDQLRKKKWTEIEINDFLLIPDDSEQPEALLLIKEKSGEVSHALSKLKPHFQELLLLKYFSGHTYQEISQILNVSLDSVKTNLYRARQKFEKVFKED